MTRNQRTFERYSFADLILDAGTCRLESDGVEIPLPGLSFDLLLTLVRRAPNVVTVDELMEAVWPGVVVAEETVGQRVKLVREALGDKRRDLIATVRGRGYRIKVPVERADRPRSAESDDDAKRQSLKPYVAAGVALAIVLVVIVWTAADRSGGDATGSRSEADFTTIAPNRSIAVLPFVNMSDDTANEYFSDGVAEEMLNRLARIPDLRVTSRTSSFAFKNRDLSIREISERLNVKYVLEGSVRKADSRVRVTAKLIDVDADAYIMSETFDKELGDIFAIQDDISTAVVTAMASALGTDGSTKSSSKRLTENLEAYELYLEASYFLQQRGLEPVSKSIALLERAVELDPSFAEAHAVLASAYITMPFYTNESTNRYVDLMKDSAGTALELDDSIALAEGVLASATAIYDWDWETAETRFQRAIALGPNNSTVWQWYAEFLMRIGHFEDARAAAEQAVRVDPVGSSVINVLGLIHHYLGDDDKALDAAERARQFGRLGGYLRAMVYMRRGEHDAAITAWEDAAPHMGLDIAWIRPYVEARSDKSKTPAALDAIGRVLDSGQRTPSGFVSEYAALGQLDTAFELIDDEIDRGLLYIPILWEPGNAALREDPRFTGLLQRLRIADFWKTRGLPASCRSEADTLRCD